MNIFRIRIKKLEIDPLFFVVAALFSFFNGIMFVLTVLAAAAIHELGHLAAIRFCGASVSKVLIMPAGLRIEFENKNLSYLKETAVALFGPLANLLSAAVLIAVSGWLGGGAYYNLFLAAHIILAVFNLFPVMPLDGGRAVYSLMLNFISLETARLLSGLFSLVFTAVIFIFGIWMMIITDYNLSMLLISVFLLIYMIRGLLSDQSAGKEIISA